MIVEVNGVPYNNFLDIKVSRGMNRISQYFTGIASYDKFSGFPIKLGDQYRILIENGNPLITGVIENVSASYTNDTKTVTVSGRDKIAPVLKSDIRNSITVSSNVSLKNLIEKILSDIGITNISVIDNVNPPQFKSKDVQSDEGDNAYETMERFSRRAQVLLSSDVDGNIVIQQINKTPLDVKLKSFIEDSDRVNNILRGDISFSTEDLYKTYIVKSQDSGFSFLKGVISDLNVSKEAEFLDLYLDFNTTSGVNIEIPPISEESQRVILAEESESESFQDRALWEASMRRARAFRYSCDVHGFMYDGNNAWEPNRIVSIEDEFCDLFGDMLIERVDYSFNLENGSITTLNFVTRSSYELQSQRDSIDERSNKTGLNIFGL